MSVTANYFALPTGTLPPVDESLLYERVSAGNGLFVRSRRPGLEACMPIGVYSVPGLAPVMSYAQWGFPKVPARFMGKMLEVARMVCDPYQMEALFHLSFSRRAETYDERTKVLDFSRGWHLEYPEQRATADDVEPVHKGAGTSEERAVIELHSHHAGRAEFSEKDDRDESGPTLRVYAVIGTIFDRPAIRVRVGMFGFFMQYPAEEFFEMPDGWACSKAYDFGLL